MAAAARREREKRGESSRRRTRLKNQEINRSRSGSGASAPTHCDSPPRARYLPGPLDLPLDPRLLSLSAHPTPIPDSYSIHQPRTHTQIIPAPPPHQTNQSIPRRTAASLSRLGFCLCSTAAAARCPSHARTRSLAQASISPPCSPHSSHLSLLTLPSPW